MRATAVLAGGLAGCALTLWLGPIAAAAALSRFGSASAPAADLETVYILIIFGPLLLLAAAGAAWCRLNPFRLGREPAAMLAAGIGIGATGVLVAAAMARLAGVLEGGGAPVFEHGLLLRGSLLILFAAAAEEVYFRGWLQPALALDLGVPAAVFLSALSFAALHVMGGARSPTTLVNLFLGGLLFGVLAARGAGLAAAVGAHFAWNWTEQIGLGLDPDPGVGSFGALIDLDLNGAGWWSSAEEGLNGGFAMTAALFTLLVPLVILSRASLLQRAGAGEPGRHAGEGAW